jgi:biopolymer transport protein ExbD
MGISTGNSRKGPRSDINITPLVDVALVLLIIFLVVVPIQSTHIPIEVPPEAGPNVVSPISPIVLFGKLDGTVELDDGTGTTRSVNRVDLARTIRPMMEALKTDRVVFVDFEADLAYADVISIMDTVKAMGKDATGQDVNPVRLALKTTGKTGAAPAIE